MENQKGYDLYITSESATVQDYLDAVNELIVYSQISRSRNQNSKCEGCPRCCAERIPLTSIDVELMMKGLGFSSFAGFINKYCHVVVDGPVVDIILAQNIKGECVFLKPDGRCSQYRLRSLVCQTFICSPSTPRAVKLRETVVNKGEDELVRRWFREGRNKKGELIIHEAWEPDLDINDWQVNAFTGKKEYRDVLLREVCTQELWHILTKER